jgi:hypothetical protein
LDLKKLQHRCRPAAVLQLFATPTFNNNSGARPTVVGQQRCCCWRWPQRDGMGEMMQNRRPCCFKRKAPPAGRQTEGALCATLLLLCVFLCVRAVAAEGDDLWEPACVGVTGQGGGCCRRPKGALNAHAALPPLSFVASTSPPHTYPRGADARAHSPDGPVRARRLHLFG